MAGRRQGAGLETFLPQPAFEPHAERNAETIGAVLTRYLPAKGTLLEVASGTGQHAVTLAPRFPGLTWLTSDPWQVSRESINGWLIHTGVQNVRSPLDLDVTAPDWETGLPRPISAIYASNLLHITPWAVTLGLFRGAANLLAADAPMCIYGCFKRDGRHLSDANAEFDANIRGENPQWGVRDLDAVDAAAKAAGLSLADIVDMPRENFMLILRPVHAPKPVRE